MKSKKSEQKKKDAPGVTPHSDNSPPVLKKLIQNARDFLGGRISQDDFKKIITKDPHKKSRKETFKVIDILYPVPKTKRTSAKIVPSPEEETNRRMKESAPFDLGQGFSDGFIAWFHSAYHKFDVVKRNEELGNCDKNATHNSEYWKEQAKNRANNLLVKIREGNTEIAQQILERWGTLKDRFYKLGIAGKFDELYLKAKDLCDKKEAQTPEAAPEIVNNATYSLDMTRTELFTYVIDWMKEAGVDEKKQPKRRNFETKLNEIIKDPQNKKDKTIVMHLKKFKVKPSARERVIALFKKAK